MRCITKTIIIIILRRWQAGRVKALEQVGSLWNQRHSIRRLWILFKGFVFVHMLVKTTTFLLRCVTSLLARISTRRKV